MLSPTSPFRLGTRGSKLALVQADEVRKTLIRAFPELAADGAIEIVPISTSGEWTPEQKERRFAEMGGNKGLFTKEIQEALLAKRIDLAVHSAKDMETVLPEGLEIAAFLPRSDTRDAFICKTAPSLEALPAGAVIGTSSLRRQAQILARRPDVKVVPFRGNVDTRLRKLAQKDVDATILALCGLQRMGISEEVACILDTETMLPAVGQGALAVEARADDARARELCAAINCAATMSCVAAERALLRALDGSCHTPVGALATLDQDGRVRMQSFVARADGTGIVRMQDDASASEAAAMGARMGAALRQKFPADFFAA